MKIYCDTQYDDLLYWVDKPYWVLTCQNQAYFWVQLHDSGYGHLSIDLINDCHVRGYDEDVASWGLGRPSHYIWHMGLSKNTSIKPTSPIEILSDDEFNEILEANDRLWERFQADDED